MVQSRSAPRRTRAGDEALRRLADDHHALSPAMRPDWAVYGPAGAALSVGVFGVGALWAADPAFAGELALQRATAASGSGLGRRHGRQQLQLRQQLRRRGRLRGRRLWRVTHVPGTNAAAEHGGGPPVRSPAATPPARRRRCAAGSASDGGRRSPASSAGFPDCGSARSSRSRSAPAPAVPPRGVAELRGRGVAVVPHGVRLSLGGAEPLDPGRVTHLAACAAAVDAPLVSEHVAFVRAGGREAGHLLPVPRSRDALDVLTAHVTTVQAELDVPLALEPIAALFDWPDDEYTEGEFLTALLERTGALLLLDVANVYANAVNRGTDPEALLDAIPLERVAYVHVAGGAEHPADPGVYHDTHTDPVPDAVLTLLERLCERLAAAARGHARARRPLPARGAAARGAGRDRRGRGPPGHRVTPRRATRRVAHPPRRVPHPARRVRVSARRVLRSGTAISPPQAALVDALVAGGPVPRASTRTAWPWPGAPWSASARAPRRRSGRCSPPRSGPTGPRCSPPPSRAGRRRPRSTTAGSSPATLHGRGELGDRRGRRAGRARGDAAAHRRAGSTPGDACRPSGGPGGGSSCSWPDGCATCLPTRFVTLPMPVRRPPILSVPTPRLPLTRAPERGRRSPRVPGGAAGRTPCRA